MTEQIDDLVESGLDALACVHGDSDEREVLRECQQAVCVEVMLGAEALDAPHNDADLELVPRIQVDERVCEKAPVRPVALAEVGRQLQAVGVHRAIPSLRPSQAARSPATRLTRKLSAPRRAWPSSPSRCDSSAQVLKVV